MFPYVNRSRERAGYGTFSSIDRIWVYNRDPLYLGYYNSNYPPPTNSVTVRTSLERMLDDSSPNPNRLEKDLEVKKVVREYGSGIPSFYDVDGDADTMYSGHPCRVLGSIGDSVELPQTAIMACPMVDRVNLTAKCLRKIRSNDPLRTSMEMFPFIGEMKQTAEMVLNPGRVIQKIFDTAVKRYTRSLGRKGLDQIRRAQRSYKKKLRRMSLTEFLATQGLGPASSLWLQYRYGWLPLISDLTAFGEAVIGFSESYEAYKASTSGGHRDTVSVRAVGVNAVEDGTVGHFTSVRESSQHIAKCKMQVTYRCSDDTIGRAEFLARKIGLHPRNLIPAVWELTKLSFVLDWVIPIGDFLEDVTAFPVEFTVDRTTYTYTVESVVEYREYSPGFPRIDGRPWMKDIGTDTFKWFRRSGNSTFTTEDSPLLTNNQALDALSLIAQRLTGTFRKKP